MRNKWGALLTACTTAVMFSAIPANLAAKGGSSAHGPSTHGPTTHGQTTHGQSAHGQTTHGQSTHGQSTHGSTTHGPKTKTSGSSTTATGSGHGSKSRTTSTSTSTAGGTSTTNTTSTFTPTNAVAEKLSTKTNLLNRVRSILGTNVDLNKATDGFRNFGQFIAAVNVSNNHPDIKFADLKAAMTGITMDGKSTGKAPVSLGQAIHQLNSSVDAETEAARAQSQANRETR